MGYGRKYTPNSLGTYMERMGNTLQNALGNATCKAQGKAMENLTGNARGIHEVIHRKHTREATDKERAMQ